MLAIPKRLIRLPQYLRLSLEERAVLLSLYAHCDGAGRFPASMDTLAELLGLGAEFGMRSSSDGPLISIFITLREAGLVRPYVVGGEEYGVLLLQDESPAPDEVIYPLPELDEANG